MGQINYKETMVTANFANPSLCRDLLIAGMYNESPYRWEVIDQRGVNHARLNTYAFDPDNYYRHGDDAISLLAPICTLPAYSLAELERLVPADYTIAFSLKSEYIIMPSSIYPELDGCVESRLPDLFGKHLLECFRKRIIDPTLLKSMINEKE